jgi:hypothetical protein
LTADERVEEIARMLGGIAITDKAREHAREMLRTPQAIVEPAAASTATPAVKRKSARSSRKP